MKLRKFQQGGPIEDPAMAQGAPVEGAPVEAQVPAEAPAEDPMEMILQGAMEAVQNNDGELALQVCAALVQMVQEQAGAAEAAPAGEPVFAKNGCKMIRRTKKASKGGRC